MSGKEIMVDTNILIYLLQEDNTLESMLTGKTIYVSFITELELFGMSKMAAKQEKIINELLENCEIIHLNSAIKEQYKKIRRSTKVKLADSVVAATAMALDMPLLTADTQFKVIKKLQLIQYESSN